MNKFNLTALSAAFCIAMSTGAIGGVMSKADYKADQADIAASYTASKSACNAMSGNAKDICIEEAKGREKVSTAQLEATDNPSAKNWYDVRIAKADANYAVAKEKCDDFSGNAKDVCRKEATAAHVTATADAKLSNKTAEANTAARETTADANATAREKTVDASKDAAADKRDAGYAVAKAKCEALADDAKVNCVKDAKTRFGQS